MRLSVFFLVLFVAQAYATAIYSQQTRLTIKMQGAKVIDVLNKIEDESEFFFLFNQKLLNVERQVNVDVENENIGKILDQIFENTNVSYLVKDRQIILTTASIGTESDQEQKPVTGKVTDSSGTPLPGVTVVVKGTTQGIITDSNGKYALPNVPENATLLFSFVGMKTQEVAVGNKSTISVTLVEETIGIEEVVAVGYGTQKKVNLTGAVSQVNSEALESRAITNVGQGLQGVVPNLNVSISNGSPNTDPSYNVRGGTSFSGNNFTQGSPLILVDGIEMDINLLNPEDIESISVLKDASSAAIYGARAAYGVMLVTTKSGKKSTRTTVSFNTSYEFSRPVATPDLLDSYTMQLALNQSKELTGQSVSTDDLNKLQWKKEYMDNPATAPVYKMVGSSIIWVGNTDVYKEAINNWTPSQKHTISVSGGSDKVNYYASIGYQQQDGLYRFNTDVHNRYNALLNLSTDINNWLSINYKVSYNKTDYTEPYNNPGKGSWWTAMGQGGIYNINMPLKTPKDSPVGEMYTDNILSYMAYGSQNKTINETNLLSVAPTIKILKGLNLKGDFSYESSSNGQKTFVPELNEIALNWTPVVSPHTTPSWLYKQNEHTDMFTLNAYGDFTKTFFDKHNVHALVGFNQEWMKYNSLWSKGTKLLTSALPVISQTLSTKTTGDSESEWAIRGAFFRLNYNYNEKYLFELNGRYDGTSKFPTYSRYKLFPSFSAGWRISEEKFAQNFKNIVSNLKIRASYGSLGNQNVSNYIYYPSYSTTSQVNYLFNGLRPMGINPPGLVSPDLTWETATTIDFGFDFSLLNKLDFTFDWYNRTTSDILVAGDQYPALLGTGAPTKNAGEMKTVGWEITTTWRDKLQNGLKYGISVVLSDYQSEITKFDGNSNKSLSSLYVGEKMGEIWGYETMGLFQSKEEIAAAPSQNKIYGGAWYPGDVRYKDLNNDGIISTGAATVDNPGDRKIIGNNTPRYQFGINMNAAWKNFDLNLFFQGVGKRDFWTSDKFYWGQISLDGVGTWNSYENSWTPENTNAFFPGYRNFDGNTQVQTRYLQNAAYVRLKNLTFGYTLPVKITKQIKIEKARIYFSGQNLWDKSNVIKTIDPETINGTYPIMRYYALGLQISF